MIRTTDLILDTLRTTSPSLNVTTASTSEQAAVPGRQAPPQTVVRPRQVSPWIDRALVACIVLLAAMILRKLGI
jgi:hypothetical protein